MIAGGFALVAGVSVYAAARVPVAYEREKRGEERREVQRHKVYLAEKSLLNATSDLFSCYMFCKSLRKRSINICGFSNFDKDSIVNIQLLSKINLNMESIVEVLEGVVYSLRSVEFIENKEFMKCITALENDVRRPIINMKMLIKDNDLIVKNFNDPNIVFERLKANRFHSHVILSQILHAFFVAKEYLEEVSPNFFDNSGNIIPRTSLVNVSRVMRKRQLSQQ